MLVIRPEQMEVFKEAALRSFEQEMVAHLFKFVQRHSEAIGKDKVLETIRLGIDRARGYGFTNRGPVRFYIQMMFMFGSAFDTDPQYPWTAEILNSTNLTDQMDRADRLYEKAMNYLDRVIGPDGTYALKALRGISEFAKMSLPFSADNLVGGMLDQMNKIYPQKYSYSGDRALRALIQEAINKANEYRFSEARGIALFIVLMFALGHGFANDPLFPWISHTLQDPRIINPASRAQRLENKMLVYLEHVLRHGG